MQKNDIVKSLIIFIFSLILLLSIKPIVIDLSSSYIETTSNFFLEKFVNEKYIFEKEAVVFIGENNNLNVDCIFFGTESGDIKRNMKIDIFLELVLPFSIVLSLSFCTFFYFKSKYLFLFISLIGSLYFLTIKILVLIFDNYNYSDFQLSEFAFPVKQFIYYSNLFINTTGSSINFLFPILFILMQFAFFEPKRNPFGNNT